MMPGAPYALQTRLRLRPSPGPISSRPEHRPRCTECSIVQPDWDRHQKADARVLDDARRAHPEISPRRRQHADVPVFGDDRGPVAGEIDRRHALARSAAQPVLHRVRRAPDLADRGREKTRGHSAIAGMRRLKPAPTCSDCDRIAGPAEAGHYVHGDASIHHFPAPPPQLLPSVVRVILIRRARVAFGLREGLPITSTGSPTLKASLSIPCCAN